MRKLMNAGKHNKTTARIKQKDDGDIMYSSSYNTVVILKSRGL